MGLFAGKKLANKIRFTELSKHKTFLLKLIGKSKLNKGSFGFDVAPNRAPNQTVARKYKLGAIGVSMFDSQYAKHDPHFTMAKCVNKVLKNKIL